MALAFVLDENLRGPLWGSIRRHNSSGIDSLDVVRVGDILELPLGISDPALLIWSTATGRLLITADFETMPAYFKEHVATHGSHPGLLLRSRSRLRQVVEQLSIIAHAGVAEDFRNQFVYIP